MKSSSLGCFLFVFFFSPEEKSCTSSCPAWLCSSQELQQEAKHRPALQPLCHCSRLLSAPPHIAWPSNLLFTGGGTVHLQVPAGSVLPGHLGNYPDGFLYGPGPNQQYISSHPQLYNSSHPEVKKNEQRLRSSIGRDISCCSFLSWEGKEQKRFPVPPVSFLFVCLFFPVETNGILASCSRCH